MSNITEQEIEKLSGIMSMFGEAHNMLAKTSLPKEEYQPISTLLASAKVELFNFYKEHKAALQKKASKPQNEEATEDEDDIGDAVRDYRKNHQSKVSDVSAECNHDPLIDTGIGYYHCPGCNKGFTYSEWENRNTSIVNERYNQLEQHFKILEYSYNACFEKLHESKDIPADFKQVTGHDSPKEMMAYEKGREDEQKVCADWIEKWDGKSNSVMGALLKKKFDELNNLSPQTNK